MKRFLLILLILALSCGFAFAFDILSYPPPLSGGNIMVDVGVGLSSYGLFFDDYGDMSIPPVFLNVEYALPVGVPISVGGFGAFFQNKYEESISGGWENTFFAFGGRANWHWGFDPDWLDFYTGIWMGYMVHQAKWYGSNINARNPPSYSALDFGAQVGAHFYFTNTIGLVLESGYPFVLKAGVALKFN